MDRIHALTLRCGAIDRSGKYRDAYVRFVGRLLFQLDILGSIWYPEPGEHVGRHPDPEGHQWWSEATCECGWGCRPTCSPGSGYQMLPKVCGSDPCAHASIRSYRRVSVAGQLITNPKILFLDEPTSGLDSTASFEVMSGMDVRYWPARVPLHTTSPQSWQSSLDRLWAHPRTHLVSRTRRTRWSAPRSGRASVVVRSDV
jgi:hypothetical protein